MLGLLQDFRYAVQMLSKSASVTANANVDPRAGNLSTTTVFSVVNAILIQPSRPAGHARGSYGRLAL
jgi:hypothetical protein